MSCQCAAPYLSVPHTFLSECDKDIISNVFKISPNTIIVLRFVSSLVKLLTLDFSIMLNPDFRGETS